MVFIYLNNVSFYYLESLFGFVVFKLCFVVSIDMY